MKIAENFEQFVERVSEAERTVLKSPAGQALTEELLQMKLAQNPNMTAEEWAQTKSEFQFSCCLPLHAGRKQTCFPF